jgi:hypothetical protein
MDYKRACDIHHLITQKGWSLYLRGKFGDGADPEKIIKQGPVDVLEKNTAYVILPRVKKAKSKQAIDKIIEKNQVMPTMNASAEVPYCGREIIQFGDVDVMEDLIFPNQEIIFIGIELNDKEVRLCSPVKTFMPYESFIKSLESLNDISHLE